MGDDGHHDARLHFSCVVTRLIEVIGALDAGPPVDGADEKIHLRLELSDYLPKIVSAMAIQDQQLFHTLARQRRSDVKEDGELRARIHVDGKTQIELAGVNAERNCWQRYDPGALVPGDFRCSLGDRGRLVGVSAIGQMVVVRLGRAPWENGDLEWSVFDRFPIGFGQNEWA